METCLTVQEYNCAGGMLTATVVVKNLFTTWSQLFTVFSLVLFLRCTRQFHEENVAFTVYIHKLSEQQSTWQSQALRVNISK
jgi:hypothetical protein